MNVQGPAPDDLGRLFAVLAGLAVNDVGLLQKRLDVAGGLSQPETVGGRVDGRAEAKVDRHAGDRCAAASHGLITDRLEHVVHVVHIEGPAGVPDGVRADIEHPGQLVRGLEAVSSAGSIVKSRLTARCRLGKVESGANALDETRARRSKML